MEPITRSTAFGADLLLARSFSARSAVKQPKGLELTTNGFGDLLR